MQEYVCVGTCAWVKTRQCIVRCLVLCLQGYDNQTSVEFDETIPPFAVACAAAQRTTFFTIVLVLVLALILTQRPSFRQPMTPGGTGGVLATRGGEQGEEGVLGEGLKHVDFILQYTSELFDLNHRGADSMLYLFCLLIAVGMDVHTALSERHTYLSIYLSTYLCFSGCRFSDTRRVSCRGRN